ncbi:hypothetical protein CHARACLAT_003768 [Characodon lateralis]|uniref:Secreted protein n=1 Tax=Characodon lateralis TaxID=208331 RepID=A0ABU7EZY4_9TELE|nr:hypothetical protein [Characodon lateralis]
MLLMVGFMRLFAVLSPQSALSLAVMLFGCLQSYFQGSLVPFESLKAIDHPLVSHVSGELTSGNYASDAFSFEIYAFCPSVHCENSRYHCCTKLLDSCKCFSLIFE